MTEVFVEQPLDLPRSAKKSQPLLEAICCTLRSRLHDISTMVRAFPGGLENNHACKWISDVFPGILTYVLFLENCQESICLHGCAPIHGEGSFFFLKVFVGKNTKWAQRKSWLQVFVYFRFFMKPELVYFRAGNRLMRGRRWLETISFICSQNIFIFQNKIQINWKCSL